MSVNGVQIMSVDADSVLIGQAAVGDRIIAINGIPVPSLEVLKQLIAKSERGLPVVVSVQAADGSSARDVSFENHGGVTLGITATNVDSLRRSQDSATEIGSLMQPKPGALNDAIQHAIFSASFSASRLSGLGVVLAVLGVIGGIVLVISGASAQSCDVSGYCDSSPNVAIIGAGIAGALFWVFVWAAADAVAARIKLAAVIAQENAGSSAK